MFEKFCIDTDSNRQAPASADCLNVMDYTLRASEWYETDSNRCLPYITSHQYRASRKRLAQDAEKYTTHYFDWRVCYPYVKSPGARTEIDFWHLTSPQTQAACVSEGAYKDAILHWIRTLFRVVESVCTKSTLYSSPSFKNQFSFFYEHRVLQQDIWHRVKSHIDRNTLQMSCSCTSFMQMSLIDSSELSSSSEDKMLLMCGPITSHRLLTILCIM